MSGVAIEAGQNYQNYQTCSIAPTRHLDPLSQLVISTFPQGIPNVFPEARFLP
ncbi:hypothetical protein [Thermoleptolyngbya sp. C42_A2020_037]|uniref:hypothetical protein n=1 Tax=Thermoleptolyngbya sp. C42_A2020_037 TaxID=2747799 RepID=UPI0019E8672B|nr:hypothetical protein [Thermoleptolyngbya sp. C42_A2020_037]MBF2087032.1 hypothetical protein [Thermoleptolyngbya sp. C42_A2020_037]